MVLENNWERGTLGMSSFPFETRFFCVRGRDTNGWQVWDLFGKLSRALDLENPAFQCANLNTFEIQEQIVEGVKIIPLVPLLSCTKSRSWTCPVAQVQEEAVEATRLRRKI